jgi:hypothetical protein
MGAPGFKLLADRFVREEAVPAERVKSVLSAGRPKLRRRGSQPLGRDRIPSMPVAIECLPDRANRSPGCGAAEGAASETSSASSGVTSAETAETRRPAESGS